ncbi:AtpZ/AtpI family protein [Bacillus weihaiensis]|nr:AtpZ/AtpI family protein [Bacillus weihaiensis]
MGLKAAILSHLVGPTIIGVFVGRWVDSYFKSEPLFLIVGLLLGLGIGIYAMYHLVQHYFSGD